MLSQVDRLPASPTSDQGPESVHLVCREDNAEQLVGNSRPMRSMSSSPTHRPPHHLRVKVFSHLLGESNTAFFAPAPEAARLRRRFPRSLHDAAVLLPTINTALRHALDEWFDEEHLRPRVVGEFEDSALVKVFGHAAGVVFPSPAAIEADVCRFYGVRVIGRTSAVRERYDAISAERRLKHPGVLAITSAARDELFTSRRRELGARSILRD
jgi:LysR family transcriptional activator of nhaA